MAYDPFMALTVEQTKSLNQMMADLDKRNRSLIHKWVYHPTYGKGQVLEYNTYNFLFTVNFMNALPNIKEVMWQDIRKIFNYNNMWLECLDLK